MAKAIEFYIPQTFRVKERYVAAGPAKIIAFPAGANVRVTSNGDLNSITAERRSNPRGGLFTRIEDATYGVLRKTKRESPDATDVDTWDRDCI